LGLMWTFRGFVVTKRRKVVRAVVRGSVRPVRDGVGDHVGHVGHLGDWRIHGFEGVGTWLGLAGLSRTSGGGRRAACEGRGSGRLGHGPALGKLGTALLGTDSLFEALLHPRRV